MSRSGRAEATQISPDRRESSTHRGIIEAALELFADRGYHGTSVPSVLEAAGVSASSLYRLFPSKEVLVNAVYREAKQRLEHALMDGLDRNLAPRALFAEFWARLSRFVEDEPTTFRFLELQDHTPYLDGGSRQRELAVLAPIVLACLDFQRRGALRADTTPDVVIATIWGAFVGLTKAARLGYLRLTPTALEHARDACWRAFATTDDVPSDERPQGGSHASRSHDDTDRDDAPARANREAREQPGHPRGSKRRRA